MAHEYSLKCTCTAETAAAIHVKDEGGKAFWVPKSVIHDDSEVYKTNTDGSLVVADWWAEKEGLE